ncbi:MAG: hypothetical protein F6K16_38400, partial [Symploca sp. SIO2B6]|nr:hypothetical protein [Symploca sp. SIO2B6]
ENAWDGEILATAIGLFPQHAQNELWRSKLIEFSLNTLSTPQDRTSTAVVDGKPLKEQVYTINLHSDYTLENHGACHFCYVASPLVSIAWSYYALASNNQPVPEALFHHVQDLWQQAKSTFLDYRFAYIGGKDWARYTYGLYFIVPALVLLQHRYDDPDARTIEQLRVGTLAAEHQANQDGSFFGKRVTRDQMFGQNAKYETDCYADLGLAYLLHKQLNTCKQATPLSELVPRLCGRNIGQESGTCYVKTPDLFASFSWRTLTQPQPIALFIPSGMDDSAEWAANNLLGRVRVLGVQGCVSIRMMKATGMGFTVKGTISYRTQRKEAFAHELSYEVVPEKNWAIVESKFIARSKVVVLRQEGLRLAIANDFFNGYQRQYRWEDGSATIAFDPDQAANRPRSGNGKIDQIQRKVSKLLDFDANTQTLGRSWVNIDEKLGVVQLMSSQSSFNLRQELGRNTPNGCLHFDVLQNPPQIRYPQIRQAGDVLLHTKFLLLAGTSSETEAIAADF